MNFIKLTSYEHNEPINVMIEAIRAVYTFHYGGTIVEAKSGDSYWVLEEPEKVREMIENTINKNNNKH